MTEKQRIIIKQQQRHRHRTINHMHIHMKHICIPCIRDKLHRRHIITWSQPRGIYHNINRINITSTRVHTATSKIWHTHPLTTLRERIRSHLMVTIIPHLYWHHIRLTFIHQPEIMRTRAIHQQRLIMKRRWRYLQIHGEHPRTTIWTNGNLSAIPIRCHIKPITTINYTNSILRNPMRAAIIPKHCAICMCPYRFIQMLHHHKTIIPDTHRILLATTCTISIIQIQRRRRINP